MRPAARKYTFWRCLRRSSDNPSVCQVVAHSFPCACRAKKGQILRSRVIYYRFDLEDKPQKTPLPGNSPFKTSEAAFVIDRDGSVHSHTHTPPMAVYTAAQSFHLILQRGIPAVGGRVDALRERAHHRLRGSPPPGPDTGGLAAGRGLGPMPPCAR
jgi:hypothetical protein